MIPCTEKYIWYKKRRLTKGKRRFSLVLAIVLIFVGVIFYYNTVSDRIYNYGQKYAYTCSAEAVNAAVLTTLIDEVKYYDLINIEKDSDGNIILITANSHKINNLSREVEKNTTILLKEKIGKGIPIPSLTFSGIGLISGYGKTVNLKTARLASVICEFDNEFKSVGINQTLHSIYIVVVCKVSFNAFFSQKETKCINKILASETVLIGRVPDIYLDKKVLS